MLELSLAISAWKSFRGNSWALRCNPSSGNLHPTEGYIVAADLPGLDGGVYHYVSRDHALEQRAHWVGTVPPIGHGVIVGLASIYWREAWKYGMRAFRYCQHDCGHAIAAVSYAAASLGWQTRMLDAAGDQDVAALLGLDRDADASLAEREEPDCLLWVGSGELPAVDGLLAAARTAHWSGRPNRLSTEHVQWPDIERAHDATRKPQTVQAHVSASVSVEPAGTETGSRREYRHSPAAQRGRFRWRDLDPRRSLLCHAGARAAERERTALECMAVATAGPPGPVRASGRGIGAGALCVPARWLCARSPCNRRCAPEWLWRKLGPAQLPLYLLLPHDTRDTAKVICCHQDIAADSCFALGMLADFQDIEASPWHYPRLYWECGLIGQVLYLEAEAAGIRATGIGCFFDDEMHRLLGLQGHAWQSLYHFTAGGAVEDARLTTLPPYGPRAPS